MAFGETQRSHFTPILKFLSDLARISQCGVFLAGILAVVYAPVRSEGRAKGGRFAVRLESRGLNDFACPVR